jgi:hypothetical protein
MRAGPVRAPKVVVFGLLTRLPFAGVVWQTVHYLEGLRRLGCDVYYVDAHGSMPLGFFRDYDDDGWQRAADWLAATMRWMDLADRWAYTPQHAGGRRYGLPVGQLAALYRDAAVLLNLHGGTEPRDELTATDRLVYVETDPVQLQVELTEERASTVAFLDAHCAYFTFAEAAGNPSCRLDIDPRYAFTATRQPVVLDWWATDRPPTLPFTTVANWRQTHRNVIYQGETYYWSKHREFARIMSLPERVGGGLQLALAKLGPSDRDRLTGRGWDIVDAADVSATPDRYRDYIAGSYGELTVAKDQNVRLATGWFSDRSATYLAAGRPVVTQDTGFGAALPTGEGLLAFTDLDSAAAAVEAVRADYPRHAAAASKIATEHFAAERVLADLLREVGV